ncbi:MFS transporter [Candidatus Parcubacteria bacterium]|nr:MAG: MFS transporter [Candidatus Parcubacteria bacterium]
MDKILLAFPAFKYKNYRLYFTGQLVSLIGVWLQIVALGWLVLKLTNSALLVGISSALSTLPVLFFVLFGGVLVDRFHKKTVLFLTQAAAMILALTLGILTITNLINIQLVFILAFLTGIINALDSPTRQAFVIQLVGREDLRSAVALNSGTFNGARIIGPAIAGFIIAGFGLGMAFILNALTFLAIIIALIFIKSNEILPLTHPHPIKAIKEGIVYSFTHPIIRILLILTAITSIFGWSYSIIMPVIAQDVFQSGAKELGYLYSATGVGALLGTILLSTISKKIQPLNLIIYGNFIVFVSLVVFSFMNNLLLSLIPLFFAGLGIIMQVSTINSTIQELVANKIRGRVMSLYVLMFMGMFPVGSLQIGFLAEHLGALNAVRIGAFILLLSGLYIFIKRDKIQKEYEENLNSNF